MTEGWERLPTEGEEERGVKSQQNKPTHSRPPQLLSGPRFSSFSTSPVNLTVVTVVPFSTVGVVVDLVPGSPYPTPDDQRCRTIEDMERTQRRSLMGQPPMGLEGYPYVYCVPPIRTAVCRTTLFGLPRRRISDTSSPTATCQGPPVTTPRHTSESSVCHNQV